MLPNAGRERETGFLAGFRADTRGFVFGLGRRTAGAVPLGVVLGGPAGDGPDGDALLILPKRMEWQAMEDEQDRWAA